MTLVGEIRRRRGRATAHEPIGVATTPGNRLLWAVASALEPVEAAMPSGIHILQVRPRKLERRAASSPPPAGGIRAHEGEEGCRPKGTGAAESIPPASSSPPSTLCFSSEFTRGKTKYQCTMGSRSYRFVLDGYFCSFFLQGKKGRGRRHWMLAT